MKIQIQKIQIQTGEDTNTKIQIQIQIGEDTNDYDFLYFLSSHIIAIVKQVNIQMKDFHNFSTA